MYKTKKFRLAAFVLAAVLGLSACASGPLVRTDHDPTVNFAQFKTWSFFTPIAMEQSGYSSWISERIKEDVQKEMAARGYQQVAEGADLLVNFQGVVEDKTSVWTMPRSDINFFYSYRHRAYFAVPVWYDETQVNQYREGTLTIDFVDGQRNRLIWTGSASAREMRKQTPEQKMAGIDQAINSIFAQYPHRVQP